jgi:hypothetical protein
MEFNVDELLKDPSFPSVPVHEDLATAERSRELTLIQFALICLLRLEGAILLREEYLNTDTEWYKKRLNDFRYWNDCQWSMATNHRMTFITVKSIQYSLREYLESDASIFSSVDDVMKSTDARKLMILANNYSSWLHKCLPGKKV